MSSEKLLPVVNCFPSLNVVAFPSEEGKEVKAHSRSDFKVHSNTSMENHVEFQFDHDVYYTPHVIRTIDTKEITTSYARVAKSVLVANKEGIRPIDTYRVSSREVGVFVEYLFYDFDNRLDGKKASWEKLSETLGKEKAELIKDVESAVREIEVFQDCIFATSQNGFRAIVRIESTQISFNDFIIDEKVIPESAYFKVHADLGKELADHLILSDFDFCEFDDSKSDWNCFFAHPRCMKTKADGTIVDLRDSYVSVPNTFGDVELSLFNHITEDEYNDFIANKNHVIATLNKDKGSYQELAFDNDDKKSGFYKLVVSNLRDDVVISYILSGCDLPYKAWMLLAFIVKGALDQNESNLSECQKLWNEICDADKSHNVKQKDYDFWKKQKGSFVTYETLLLAMANGGFMSKDLASKVKLSSSPLSLAINKAKKVIKPKAIKKQDDQSNGGKKVKGIELRFDGKGAVLTDRENIERILLGDPNFKTMFYYDFFDVKFKANNAIRLIKNGSKLPLVLEKTYSFSDNTLGILASYISLNYGLLGDNKIAGYLKQIMSDICNSNPDDPIYQDFQKTLIIEKFEDRYQDWQKAKEKHYNNHMYSALNTWLPESLHIDPIKHKDYYDMYALYGRKVILGLVQRALATDHATQAQWMLILRGKQQGTGKSYFANVIIQSLIDKFKAEGDSNKYINNRKEKASQGINGILNNFGKLIELHEENAGHGNSVSKKDQAEQAKDQKAEISTAQDTFTLKMKNDSKMSNRTYIHIGNTNEPEFLFDPSGNRRYLIVDFDIEDQKTGEYIVRLSDDEDNETGYSKYKKVCETGNTGFFDRNTMFRLLKIAIGEAYARGVLGEDKHLYENLLTLSGTKPKKDEIFISMPQINRKTGSHNFNLDYIDVENNQPSQGDIKFYDQVNGTRYVKRDTVDEQWITEFLSSEKSNGGLGQSLIFKSSDLEAFQTARHRPGMRKLAITLKKGFKDIINGITYEFSFKQSNSNGRYWTVTVKSNGKDIGFNPYLPSSLSTSTSTFDALDNVVNDIDVIPSKTLSKEDELQAKLEAKENELSLIKKSMEEQSVIFQKQMKAMQDQFEKQMLAMQSMFTQNNAKIEEKVAVDVKTPTQVETTQISHEIDLSDDLILDCLPNDDKFKEDKKVATNLINRYQSTTSKDEKKDIISKMIAIASKVNPKKYQGQGVQSMTISKV